MTVIVLFFKTGSLCGALVIMVLAREMSTGVPGIQGHPWPHTWDIKSLVLRKKEKKRRKRRKVGIGRGYARFIGTINVGAEKKRKEEKDQDF